MPTCFATIMNTQSIVQFSPIGMSRYRGYLFQILMNTFRKYIQYRMSHSNSNTNVPEISVW